MQESQPPKAPQEHADVVGNTPSSHADYALSGDHVRVPQNATLPPKRVMLAKRNFFGYQSQAHLHPLAAHVPKTTIEGLCSWYCP